MGDIEPSTLPSQSNPNTSTTNSLSVRILTHNIRYATRSPFKGELPWSQRRSHLLAELQYHTRTDFTNPSTVICLQEVLHEQLIDIATSLGSTSANDHSKGNPDLSLGSTPTAQPTLSPESESEWHHVGVARDDGIHAGEYSPLFFRRLAWTLQHFQTIWLSPTPDVPGSKGWDAASVRILTVAVLESRLAVSAAGGKGLRVLALNTHLDDQGAVSRREAAKIIIHAAHCFASEWDVDGYFLAGDLNSEVDDDAWRIFNDEGSGFVDVRRLVGGHGTSGEMRGYTEKKKEEEGEEGEQQVYGNEMTFTGFNARGDGEGVKRIDFVHLGTLDFGQETDRDPALSNPRAQRAAGKVKGYAVLPNKFDDGVCLSDHRAVMADVCFW